MKRAGIELNAVEVENILASEGSKSSKMKMLFDQGLEIKEIANMMDVRYNFVYNVVSNYVNMNGIKVEKSEKFGKKDQIISLHCQGMSNKEISIELKTNYNYVFNVLKKWKMDNEVEEDENEVNGFDGIEEEARKMREEEEQEEKVKAEAK